MLTRRWRLLSYVTTATIASTMKASPAKIPKPMGFTSKFVPGSDGSGEVVACIILIESEVGVPVVVDETKVSDNEVIIRGGVVMTELKVNTAVVSY